MSEGSWSISPAGVAEVLNRVDEDGNQLEQVSRRFVNESSEHYAALDVDGRSTVSSAWKRFCEARTEVPQNLMWLLLKRCDQVSQATAEVLFGDEEMSSQTALEARMADQERYTGFFGGPKEELLTAQQEAHERWGITTGD